VMSMVCHMAVMIMMIVMTEMSLVTSEVVHLAVTMMVPVSVRVVLSRVGLVVLFGVGLGVRSVVSMVTPVTVRFVVLSRVGLVVLFGVGLGVGSVVSVMGHVSTEVSSVVAVMGHMSTKVSSVVSVVANIVVTSMMRHVVTTMSILVIFDFDCLGGNCDCGCKGYALEHGFNL